MDRGTFGGPNLWISSNGGFSQEQAALEHASTGKLPHPMPLIKSALQKAVRRGLPRAAVAAAAYLLAHEPKELLRRLPVILAEDVGIFADIFAL